MKTPLTLFWLVNSTVFYVLCSGNPTSAQIVPDVTLPVNSSVTQQGNTTIIEGGTTAGTNLFHSFESFSVPTGGIAFFNNAIDIQNIFSRITGNSISNIDGLIRANGVANLFLINPNGIIFGANARLNIGGSFLGSTASSIRFADEIEFNATNPNAPPLLTVNVPIGLQFVANTPNPNASIIVRGTGNNLTIGPAKFGIGANAFDINTDNRPLGLGVQPDRTLALLGGDVILEGGNLTAPSGRIELGSVAPGSSVTLIQTNSGWQLGYEGVQNFQDIRLTKAASLDSSGDGSGSIQLSGRRVTLADGAAIFSLSEGSKSGGTLRVSASESVELIGIRTDSEFPSSLTTIAERKASGNGGDIVVETPRLTIRDGGRIVSESFGRSNAGNLIVKATDVVELITTSDTYNYNLFTGVYGSGSGGNLTIETGRLIVRDGAQIRAENFGSEENRGNVTVRARDSVELIGSALVDDPVFPINSTLETRNNNLMIETERLIIKDGALIFASYLGEDKGINVTVRAKDSVELIGRLSNRDLIGDHGLLVAGPGSNLTIETGRVIVQDAGEISISPTIAGVAGTQGTLLIKATDSIELIGVGSTLESTTNPDSDFIADAGGFTIETGRLIVRDGASINVDTFNSGAGKAGTVTIRARDSVEVIGRSNDEFKNPSRLSASTFFGSGFGGDFTIETRRLIVGDGGTIKVSSVGRGKAGNVTVQAADSIELSNKGSLDANTTAGGGSIELRSPTITLLNSSITTNATGGESGGDINVQGQFLQLRDSSTITTNASGIEVKGGNITLNTNILAALENSDITANAVEGKGGEIAIDAQAIFGAVPRTREELQLLNTKDFNPRFLESSDITAISQQGSPQLQGSVTVNTPDVDPTSGLIELPVDIVDVTRLIARGCPAARGNSFTVTGRGGLPTLPSEPLRPNNTVSVDWVSDRQQQKNLARTLNNDSTPSTQLVEATGWIMNDKKQVVLTASARTATPIGFATSCGETVEVP